MGNKKTTYNADKENAVFAKKLREIAKEQKTTQQALADYISKHTGETITRQSVGQWFIGATCPSLRTVPLIANFFGVSTDYLLTETETKTSDEIIRAAVDDLGISEKTAENIRSITRSGGNVNILLERDEFKDIVDLLNKIKTISVGKRYYNKRIATEFEAIHKTLFKKSSVLYGIFALAINSIEQRHLSGDVSVNSDDPYDQKIEQGKTGFVSAVNDDEIYTERLNIVEYRLTKDFFNKMLEAVENDTISDKKLFKNYDDKVGKELDCSLINLQSNLEYGFDNYYTGDKLKAKKQETQEIIKDLEEFIKFYNEHYRKDGAPNG